MANLILTVDGMTCGGCANSIKKALAGVPGVAEVEVDLVSVQHDGNADEGALRSAIENAGFDVIG
jgi:copper chaperone